MELDFDSFALQQWDTVLPPLPLPSQKRSQSTGLKPSKFLIRDAILKEIVHDYQKNIPIKFETGKDNNCVGFGIELRRRKSGRPVSSIPAFTISKPPSPKYLARCSIPKHRRVKSAKATQTFRTPKFKKRPLTAPQIIIHKKPPVPVIKNDPPIRIENIEKAIVPDPKTTEKEVVPYNPFAPPPITRFPKRRSVKSAQKPRSSSPKAKHKNLPKKMPVFSFTPAPKRIENIFQLIQKLIQNNLANQTDPEKVARLQNALIVVDEYEDEDDLLKNAPRLSSILNDSDFKIPNDVNVMDLESDNFMNFIEQLPELKKKVEVTIQVKKLEPKVDSGLDAHIVPASYRRLSSSVIVPYQTLVASRSKKDEVLQEEEENQNGETDVLKFIHDYEALLHRQQAIEQRAFTKNLDETISNSAIARFPFEELLDIIWNLFIHMKIMYEEVLPESTSKAVYGIFRNFQDKQTTINRLKDLMDDLPRDVFVYTKNFSNHLQRIVTGCSENIGGPKRLLIALSNLFGFVFFRKAMPKLNEKYIPDHLKLRQINFGSSESINSIQSSINSIQEEKIVEFEHPIYSRNGSNQNSANNLAIHSYGGSEISLNSRHNSDVKLSCENPSRRGSDMYLGPGSPNRPQSVSSSRHDSYAKLNGGLYSRRGSYGRVLSGSSSRRNSANMESIPTDVELSIVSEKTEKLFAEEDSLPVGFEDDSNWIDQELARLKSPIQTKQFVKQLSFMEPQANVEKVENQIDKISQDPTAALNHLYKMDHTSNTGRYYSHPLPRGRSSTNGNLISGMTIELSNIYTSNHELEKRSIGIKRSDSSKGKGLVKGLSFGHQASVVDDYQNEISRSRRSGSENEAGLVRGQSFAQRGSIIENRQDRSSTLSRSGRSGSEKEAGIVRGQSFAQRESIIENHQDRSSILSRSRRESGFIRRQSFKQRGSEIQERVADGSVDNRILAKGLSFGPRRGKAIDESGIPALDLDSRMRKRISLVPNSSFKKEILSHSTSFKRPTNQERGKESKGRQMSFIQVKRTADQKKLESLPSQSESKPRREATSKGLKSKAREMSVKQKHYEKLFGWDYINRDNLSEFILDQEFVLTPFSAAIEYFIINGEKIFSRA